MKSKSQKISDANSSGMASACSTNSDSISHTNTDLSGDSGYQSRLCVDLNQEYENETYSCACDVNKIYQEKSKTISLKDQVESMLKCLLNDYLRVKDENESLRIEVELRGKTIDTLHENLVWRLTFLLFGLNLFVRLISHFNQEQFKLEKIEHDRRVKELEKREVSTNCIWKTYLTKLVFNLSCYQGWIFKRPQWILQTKCSTQATFTSN